MRRKVLTLFLIAGVITLFAACAPQPNSDASPADGTEGEAPAEGAEGETSAAAWWSPDSDCATCHKNSAATLASHTCEAAQADDPNKACLTCHDDVAYVESAHKDVAMSDTAGDDTRLKVSKIQESACLSCHNRDDLVAATAGVTDLTDFKGTTINPHEASTVHNVNGAHDNINCGSCHKMHSTDGVPTGKVAYDYCIECHHSGEFVCNTCH